MKTIKTHVLPLIKCRREQSALLSSVNAALPFSLFVVCDMGSGRLYARDKNIIII